MTSVPATPHVLAARVRRLTDSLASSSVDALLVTSLINVRYLTGFTGSAGAALITREGEVQLAVDGRYAEQAAAQCPGVPVLVTRAYGADLLLRGAEAGAGRVAVEAHALTLEAYDVLRAAVPDVHLAPVARLVELLRAVKDAEELAHIRSACRISEAALQAVLAAPLRGRTEREVARELDQRMADGGAAGPAFDTIVAAGPASALPHHEPDSRVLEPGDLVVIDFGARVEGYASDMTRTVFVSGPGEHGGPAAWQSELHAHVLAAQSAARAALVPGESSDEGNRLARKSFAAVGLEDRFVHGLGHGVGLEVHERPLLGVGPAVPLETGMVLAVEPGLYLPGRGGVRVEDLFLVGLEPAGGPRRRSVAPGGHNEAVGRVPPSQEGEAEALTTMTRDLLVLP
jgi:Xaa-Pro aminopeptidase